MGRRALHSAEELKQMILSSSREILERDGINGLSARAIAKQIGYSPGTLYNVFKNLDDLISTIERALLQEGLAALRAVPRQNRPSDQLRALAECYISFALKNRRLWNVLFQHTPNEDVADLQDVKSTLRGMRQEFGAAVAALTAGGDPAGAERLAASVWFCIHGLSAIAVSEKEIDLDPSDAASYVGVMTDAVIALAEKRGGSQI